LVIISVKKERREEGNFDLGGPERDPLGDNLDVNLLK